MYKNNIKNTLRALAALAVACALIVPAQAATTASGEADATVGQHVEIAATDAAIALGSATPSGSGTTAHSTVDSLAFSNGASNIQAAWDLSVSAALTRSSDGVTVADGVVSYQGSSSNLQDLVYLAQGSSGAFLPWKIATGTDLSIESTGWTSHADCAVGQYKGSFSVGSFSNGGVRQAATTLYYQVCDSGTEIYTGATKDLSASDKAIIISQSVDGATATAANYELSIQGVDYVFYSAADAQSVTLQRGHHVALGSTANTESVYALIDLPTGFPAGSMAVTVTASASSIVA